MEAVAARDVIRSQLDAFSLVIEMNRRMQAFEIVDRNIGALKVKITGRRQAPRDHVLDELVLAVDRDRATLSERRKRDAKEPPVKGQPNAVMHHAFAIQSRTETRRAQQIDGSLFENTSANAVLTVFAGTQFDNDGMNAGPMQ